MKRDDNGRKNGYDKSIHVYSSYYVAVKFAKVLDSFGYRLENSIRGMANEREADFERRKTRNY